jgi:hypothetical protein
MGKRAASSVVMALFFLTGILPAARADILVRFPPESDPVWVSAVSKEIEISTGIPTVGIVAVGTRKTETDIDLPDTASSLLDNARVAYKELRLDQVLKVLETAESACLDETSFSTCRPFLFEVNLLRGMALEALGKPDEAAQMFRSAHLADRSRVIDPRLYPPSILRAFAKACSASPTPVTSTLSLTSSPDGAGFRVDGATVEAPRVDLSPGRHIVEASFIGHQDAWKMIEVAPGGSKPVSLRFKLVPTSDIEAWKVLVERISSPAFHPAEPGMTALLERFNVATVLLFDHSEEGEREIDAEFAETGTEDLIILPSPGRPGETLSDPFQRTLMKMLGLAPAPPKVVEVAPLPPPEPPDEADVPDEEEEEEDPSIQFTETDEETEPTVPEEKNRIVKSPWLWISVGVVAAIVAGFVVTVKATD